MPQASVPLPYLPSVPHDDIMEGPRVIIGLQELG